MRLMRTEASIDHNHITGAVFLATSAPMCLDGTSLSRDNDGTGGGGGGNTQLLMIQSYFYIITELHQSQK